MSENLSVFFGELLPPPTQIPAARLDRKFESGQVRATRVAAAQDMDDRLGNVEDPVFQVSVFSANF